MTVYLDEVRDLQGNEIPREIKYTKSIANLDVSDISAEFDIRLDIPCDSSDTIDELEEIQKPVSSMLRLESPNRVVVISNTCFTSYIQAQLKILPASTRRQLRADQHQDSADDSQEMFAIEAFYELLEKSSSRRRLESTSDFSSRSLSFDVDSLKVIPSESDVQRFSLNSQPSVEEEMILAVGEGLDEHLTHQREHILRSEQRVATQLNETELRIESVSTELAFKTNAHIDEVEQKIEQNDAHIEDVDAHIGDVDKKLNDILALLTEQSSDGHIHVQTPMGPHSKEEWDVILERLQTTERQRNAYQMMSFGFVLFASASMVVATMLFQRKQRTDYHAQSFNTCPQP